MAAARALALAAARRRTFAPAFGLQAPRAPAPVARLAPDAALLGPRALPPLLGLRPLLPPATPLAALGPHRLFTGTGRGGDGDDEDKRDEKPDGGDSKRDEKPDGGDGDGSKRGEKPGRGNDESKRGEKPNRGNDDESKRNEKPNHGNDDESKRNEKPNRGNDDESKRNETPDGHKTNRADKTDGCDGNKTNRVDKTDGEIRVNAAKPAAEEAAGASNLASDVTKALNAKSAAVPGAAKDSFAAPVSSNNGNGDKAKNIKQGGNGIIGGDGDEAKDGDNSITIGDDTTHTAGGKDPKDGANHDPKNSPACELESVKEMISNLGKATRKGRITQTIILSSLMLLQLFGIVLFAVYYGASIAVEKAHAKMFQLSKDEKTGEMIMNVLKSMGSAMWKEEAAAVGNGAAAVGTAIGNGVSATWNAMAFWRGWGQEELKDDDEDDERWSWH